MHDKYIQQFLGSGKAVDGVSLEFTFAARAWSEVSLGSFEGWRERFVRTQKFFEPRFAGNIEVGNAMIKAVLKSITH